MKNFTRLNLILLLAASLLSGTLGVPVAHAASISAPNNNGLVGYWKLDEGTGTKANDSSGNGNAGTLSGSPSWVNGKIGKALSFNGSNSTISIGDSSQMDGNSFTFSAWINSNSIGTEQMVFSNTNGSIGWHIEVYLGKVILQVYPGGAYTLSTNSLTSNTWYHITVVYNNGAVSYYLNGAPNGTASYSYTVPTGLNKNIGLFFNGSYPWNGKMDDIRFYNRVLSATEISTLYQSGSAFLKPANNNGLVGYWPMNEATSTVVHDMSGNNNSGTTTATWASGKTGGALKFNGSSDYAALSRSPFGGTSFTIAGWIKLSALQDKKFISTIDVNPSVQTRGVGFGVETSAVNGINGNSIFLQTGRPGWAWSIWSSPTNSLNTTNQWYHVVAVLTGGNTSTPSVTFYINGVAQSATSWPSGIDSVNYGPSADAAARIGGSYTVTSPSYDTNYFNGFTDDLRVYNRALSAAEVTDLYRSGSFVTSANNNNFLTSGLVGLWSFDGQDINWLGNTVYDRSGQGNNGTMSGLNIFSTAVGKLGQALKFNGSTSYVIKSSASFANTPGTVSLWFKTDSINTEGAQPYQKMALVQYGDTYWALQISSATNKIQYYNYNGGQQAWSSSDTISTGRWYHLVAVSTPSGSEMFLNGVSQGTSAITFFNNVCGAGCNFIVGGNIAGFPSGDTMNGTIDDVRIYNRVLSANEVKQLYNLGR